MNPTAAELLNLFENLSRQESDLADLQRTMRYDRLGVNDVVEQIQQDYDANCFPNRNDSFRSSINLPPTKNTSISRAKRPGHLPAAFASRNSFR